MGNEYVFQMLAGQNIETLNKYGMAERTIITACPHCFNTIGNEYGQLGGNFRIRHHSEYLADLVRKGRTLEQVQAAGPTREFDERWGKGFIKPDVFVQRVFIELKQPVKKG